MLNLNVQELNLNLNQHSPVRSAPMCAYYCAQMSYTTRHRTVLIIFPLILQTITIVQMMFLILPNKQTNSTNLSSPHTHTGNAITHRVNVTYLVFVQCPPRVGSNSEVSPPVLLVTQVVTSLRSPQQQSAAYGSHRTSNRSVESTKSQPTQLVS